MAKTKFNIITSTCVPLPLENVDTDQIMALQCRWFPEQGFCVEQPYLQRTDIGGR